MKTFAHTSLVFDQVPPIARHEILTPSSGWQEEEEEEEEEEEVEEKRENKMRSNLSRGAVRRNTLFPAMSLSLSLSLPSQRAGAWARRQDLVLCQLRLAPTTTTTTTSSCRRGGRF